MMKWFAFLHFSSWNVLSNLFSPLFCFFLSSCCCCFRFSIVFVLHVNSWTKWVRINCSETQRQTQPKSLLLMTVLEDYLWRFDCLVSHFRRGSLWWRSPVFSSHCVCLLSCFLVLTMFWPAPWLPCLCCLLFLLYHEVRLLCLCFVSSSLRLSVSVAASMRVDVYESILSYVRTLTASSSPSSPPAPTASSSSVPLPPLPRFSSEQVRYVERVLRDFRRNGLHLPGEDSRDMHIIICLRFISFLPLPLPCFPFLPNSSSLERVLRNFRRNGLHLPGEWGQGSSFHFIHLLSVSSLCLVDLVFPRPYSWICWGWHICFVFEDSVEDHHFAAFLSDVLRKQNNCVSLAYSKAETYG